jgi:hypothetical protein
MRQPLFLLRQPLLEKVVPLDIVDMDINMNDHEIVEQDFQEIELAMRDLTVGSMLGYRNQNSGCSPVERVVCSYVQKYC